MSDSRATGAMPSEESPAQRAARLRREKRSTRITSEGSDRLNKIVSLAGRPAPVDEVPSTKPSPARSAQLPSKPYLTNDDHHDDDPAEIDISQMFQRQQPPPDVNSQDPQALLRQLMGGGGPQGGQDAQGGEAGAANEDPIMQMMQQLMGGGGGGGGEGGMGGGLPPGLASMFGGQQQPEPDTTANNIWRIVHAAFSLFLGLYAVSTFTFTGSKAGRNVYTGETGAPRLFWIFATVELLLQSSRYFVDGGRLPVSGIIGGLGQMLPEPYAGYVRIFSRYSVIYTTVVSDAMVVLFVLGCVAWWKGLAAS